MVYGTIDGLSYPFLAEDINAIMFFLKKKGIFVGRIAPTEIIHGQLLITCCYGMYCHDYPHH